MLEALNNFLWDRVLLYGLIGAGLAFTVVSRAVQFRYFTRMFAVLRLAFHQQGNHLSSFQALALSVAGRVGAGNIAGVAVAITLGGPGAVFWMWITGLVGMATSYFECSLAQLYKRNEPDGTYRGGPAYYIQHGLGQRWLAILFSVLLLVTFGLAFNAIQSFALASSFQDAFGIAPWITGSVLVVVLGAVIFGGVRRIAAVAEIVVPLMALAYIAIALLVIALNMEEIPGVLALIVRSAFGLEPALGGGAGAAILYGVRRGLFSNEAGLGSAPNVAATAYVHHPASQGIVQSFSVFIDTMLICTCTACIILLSDAYQAGVESSGIALTQIALAEHVGEWGRSFVSIALTFFVFTSVIYNYYLGENSLNFFSEENRALFIGFRVLVLALVWWAALQDPGTVFGFGDLTMACLAVVNLSAVLLLSRTGLRLMRDYDAQRAAGAEHPVLRGADYADLDIDPAAWADADRY